MGVFMMEFLAAAWAMLATMAPYLLLGFAASGLLSVFVSPEVVERHLGGRRLGQVFKAALLGVPLPLCSCSVIPVAASLRRHGAGKGATTAFLMSTPQTGVDSIAVTWALLGPFLAVYRPLAALVTGFLGGTLVHFFDREREVAPAGAGTAGAGPRCEAPGRSAEGLASCCEPAAAVARSPWLRAAEYGLVTLPRDIGRALIVGLLLAGLVATLVEPAALEGKLGSGLMPIVAAMLIGLPIYVCDTGSIPIALALIHAGLSPGAALAFLIAGPATNTATLTTVWRVLGRRALLLFLATIALGAVGSGLLVDGVIAAGLVPEGAVASALGTDGHSHHEDTGSGVGGWVGRLSAVALLLVLGNALRPRRRPAAAAKEPDDRSTILELRISGMRCNGCVQSLSRALAESRGVRSVAVRLEDGTARVVGRDMSAAELVEAVRSLGFTLDNPHALDASPGAPEVVP